MWEKDILKDYLQTKIELKGGYIATLVKKNSKIKHKKAVLYIHGLNDYFFQTHYAEKIEKINYKFYALDLRGYGRSIGHGTKLVDDCYTNNLKTYFEEINKAIQIIKNEGYEKIVLSLHSTSGLTGTYFASKYPEKISGIILNDPFIVPVYNTFSFKVIITIIAYLMSKIAPKKPISLPENNDITYIQALHKKYYGEWDFNLSWKKPLGVKVRWGWLYAIRKAQIILVSNGFNIKVPILLATSDKFKNIYLIQNPNNDEKITKEKVKLALTHDIFIDPKLEWKSKDKFGSNVKIEVIKKGCHDLVLSKKPTRDNFIKKVQEFLNTI